MLHQIPRVKVQITEQIKSLLAANSKRRKNGSNSHTTLSRTHSSRANSDPAEPELDLEYETSIGRTEPTTAMKNTRKKNNEGKRKSATRTILNRTENTVNNRRHRHADVSLPYTDGKTATEWMKKKNGRRKETTPNENTTVTNETKQKVQAKDQGNNSSTINSTIRKK